MNHNHITGLTTEQVLESRMRHGSNVLTPPAREPLWRQFLKKFNDPLIKILLVALILSVALSLYEYFGLHKEATVLFEPIGIFVAIVLATLVGFLVEVNANKKFRLLNQTDDHVGVKVMRDGHITQVPRCDIVVGDIVILDTGEKVPADGNVIDSFNLTVDESSFTGEPRHGKPMTRQPLSVKRRRPILQTCCCEAARSLKETLRCGYRMWETRPNLARYIGMRRLKTTSRRRSPSSLTD